MEWFILLAVIPLIVVPAVVLGGFAGCDKVFGINPLPEVPPTPTNLQVVSKDLDRLSFQWDYPDPAPVPVTFEIQLLEDGSPNAINQTDLTETSVEVTNLTEGTVYFAQVRAVTMDGRESNWEPAVPLPVATLSYQTVF